MWCGLGPRGVAGTVIGYDSVNSLSASASAGELLRLEAPTGRRGAHLLALALDTGAHAHRALFVHLALRVHDCTAVGVDEPCGAVWVRAGWRGR